MTTDWAVDAAAEQFTLDALNRGEVYTLMAWMMVTAVAIIFFNMLADIAYGWLDPRIRLG